MSATSATEPEEQAPASAARPWQIATAILAVLAVALGAWALSLNADLDDTTDAGTAEIQALNTEIQDLKDEVEELTAATEKVTLQREKVRDKLGDAKAALAVTADQLAVTEQQVAAAAQAAKDASSAAATAQGQAQSARLCAKGAVQALDLLVADDAERAAAVIETVTPACEAAGV